MVAQVNGSSIVPGTLQGSMEPHAPAESDHTNRILAALLLAGVSFALSQTLVIPALPQIGAELGASQATISWILTAFLLSASVATPIVGKLGDVYGKGRVLTVVLVLFSIGAVICALATSVAVLIAGRALQGIAGGVFPLAFGVIRDTFPSRRVPGGLAIMSAVFGIGGGIGLPLSGLIVDNIALAWLFWIGLLALPAAVAAHFVIPPSPPVRRPRIDWPGAAVLSVGLGAILIGVTQANSWGWGSPRNLGAILGGLAMLCLFVWIEMRVAEPLIDISLLRRRTVAATNLATFIIGLAMFGAFLLVPQFAQAPQQAGYGFDATVTQAGLLVMPTAIAQLAAGAAAGRLGPLLSWRTILTAGATFAAASFVLLVAFHSTEWELILANILLGVGIAFAFAATANLIVGAVPREQVGIATGINTVMRTVGGAFGSAIATAILTGHLIDGTQLPTEQAYTTAFVVSTGAAILAIAAALLVPRASSPRAAEA
jgi:EmrB/QacA subfamily drug resistance transporter